MKKTDEIRLRHILDSSKEALEIREDKALAGIAEAREKTFKRKDALKHAHIWT